MRIVIATTKVPFIRGGAEAHAEGLLKALRKAGHNVEIISFPFKWYPPEKIINHILACRLLDLTESSGNKIDLLIGLKFPAYLIPHPHKVLWILHQHRSAYDLWNHPLNDLILSSNGAEVRNIIHTADKQLIPEAKAVYTNSRNVSKRLKSFCNIDSIPLYHPPQGAEHFFCEVQQEYLFFPSRIWPVKRQSLALEALSKTTQPVCIYFAGTADSPDYEKEIRNMALNMGVQDRCRWLGNVSEQEKIELYARCLGVVYPPVDEDYGYVTLEAMLSSKPVLTCSDSGGVLEFVRHKETGLVAEPTPESLAAQMDELWTRRKEAQKLGETGKMFYKDLGISWDNVVRKLTQ
jgi:glycosyltransferase involved in cell wall biosynthesis